MIWTCVTLTNANVNDPLSYITQVIRFFSGITSSLFISVEFTPVRYCFRHRLVERDVQLTIVIDALI